MELYSSTEVAEILEVSSSTMCSWHNTKKFVAEEKVNGLRIYTKEQIDNRLYDNKRKSIDRKLVVLSLQQKMSTPFLKVLEYQFGNVRDDKCYPIEIFGVPEEELLSNVEFKKLVRELVGSYIYRLVVFKNDFKEGSDAFDYIKIACEETRTSLKFVEGGEVDEE